MRGANAGTGPLTARLQVRSLAVSEGTAAGQHPAPPIINEIRCTAHDLCKHGFRVPWAYGQAVAVAAKRSDDV